MPLGPSVLFCLEIELSFLENHTIYSQRGTRMGALKKGKSMKKKLQQDQQPGQYISMFYYERLLKCKDMAIEALKKRLDSIPEGCKAGGWCQTCEFAILDGESVIGCGFGACDHYLRKQ